MDMWTESHHATAEGFTTKKHDVQQLLIVTVQIPQGQIAPQQRTFFLSDEVLLEGFQPGRIGGVRHARALNTQQNEPTNDGNLL